MASLACSDGFGCLPSQPTERTQRGGDSRARATKQPHGGHLGGAAFIVRHSPASGTCLISLTLLAIANSYLVLPLSHTLQRKRRAVGLQPGQGGVGISAAAASTTRQSHPNLLRVPRAAPTRQRHRARERPTLWPKANRERGKSTREKDRGSRQLVATLAAQPAFLCQIPRGAPRTFLALELWVIGQMDASSSVAGAAGRAPNTPPGRFCRAGLCPPWDAGREGDIFGLSPAGLKHSLHLACCGHTQRHPTHPQPVEAAASPASKVSYSLAISEHTQNVCPLKQSRLLSPSH